MSRRKIYVYFHRKLTYKVFFFASLSHMGIFNDDSGTIPIYLN